ncbi:MAG: hypothetical protein KTR26_14085 [Flammeovirgaceae bacterium]|nr:hypothetical protein [Flammeovirgaceae bacterium]
MRPLDLPVLLKIIALKGKEWRNIDLAVSLKISASEISESLNRCKIAGLIDLKKRKVNRLALQEFLIYGLKYVFPVVPGPMVRGIPTAHSGSPINKKMMAGNDMYVWPYAKGEQRGQAIEPLYKTLPEIVLEDQLFYELMVIADTLRVGRAREIKIAKQELEKRLINE